MSKRILHTSDFHLQSLGDSACTALEDIVNLAIKMKVDMVLIAGDLFDHNRVNDNLVTFVVKQMGRLEMPAIILPGNHDCLVPDSVFERESLWQACNNVHILRQFGGETVNLPGLTLWGKPIGSCADIRPLAGIPRPQQNGQWHIAMAHGYYLDNPISCFSMSYQITREEVVTCGWDYIALGHWPTFRCVCASPVKAYYCDSPSCGSPNSTANIVELTDEEGIRIMQCPLTK